ncbi:MAG: glycosyltransferase [Gemmatimonadales bacterium]
MGHRIVLTSFGSYGDVFPYLGLGLELRARGHFPVLAMPGYARDLVEGEGLEFHPVRPDGDLSDTATIARIMDPARGTEYLIRDIMATSLQDTEADLKPVLAGADLVVTHPISFAAVYLTQKAGLPWVSTVLAPISFFSRYDMPVAAVAPWTKRLEVVPGFARLFTGLGKAMARRWLRPVEARRRALGLPPGQNPLVEGQHSPHAVIALFSRLLADPKPDWPPSVSVTGAVEYNGPDAEQSLSPDLQQFLAAGPAPVVFTLGSAVVNAAGTFFTESLAAVDQLGVRAVMLVGAHDQNRPRGPIPETVHLEPYASHAALFPHASAIVHQGGIGTLHQALRSGRPTLIVPFSHDQPDNAFRVARLGNSRTLFPNRYRAARVARELSLLLNDTSHRDQAEAIGEQVRGERGAAAACDVIEAQLPG